MTGHGTPGDGPFARGYVHVIEVASGISSVDFDEVRQRIVSVRWSPDGRFIAGLNLGDFGEVVIWQASSGALVRRISEAEETTDGISTFLVGSIYDFGWSPDSSTIAAFTSLKIAFWNVDPFYRKMRSEYVFATDAIDWSPDGQRIVAVSADQAAIQFVDPHTGKIVGTIPTDDRVRAVAWSPDGKQITLGGDTLTVIPVIDAG